MQPRIKNITTQLSQLPTSTLRDIIKQNSDLSDVANRELVLRSLNQPKKESKPEEAIAICDEQLKKNPEDNFYNFARALHERDPIKKKQWLLTAVHSNQPYGDSITAQIAYELFIVFFDTQQLRDAQAWLLKAIILGSEKANHTFLYGHQGWLVSRAVFLGAILSKVEFKNFLSSPWCYQWNIHNKALFNEANYKTQDINDLHVKNHAINTIANKFIEELHPYSYDFFTYCALNQIISEEVYVNLMWFSLNHITNQESKNLTNHSLFLFYLKQKNINQAIFYFNQLTSFEMCKVSDLEALTGNDRDSVSYCIFKKLISCHRPQEALPFLNNVENCGYYDMTIFDYFKQADPEETNSLIFEYKKQRLNSILSNKQFFYPPFIEYVQKEDKEAIKFSTQIRYLFHAIVAAFSTYDEIRNLRKQNNPLGFLKGGKTRGDFKDQWTKLSKHPMLRDKNKHSQQEYENLLAEFSTFIQEGEQKFLGKKIGKPFSNENPEEKKFFTQQIAMPFAAAERTLERIKDLIPLMTFEDAEQQEAQEPSVTNVNEAVMTNDPALVVLPPPYPQQDFMQPILPQGFIYPQPPQEQFLLPPAPPSYNEATLAMSTSNHYATLYGQQPQPPQGNSHEVNNEQPNLYQFYK